MKTPRLARDELDGSRHDELAYSPLLDVQYNAMFGVSDDGLTTDFHDGNEHSYNPGQAYQGLGIELYGSTTDEQHIPCYLASVEQGDAAYGNPDPGMPTLPSQRSDVHRGGQRRLRDRKVTRRTDSPISSSRDTNSRVSKSPRPRKIKASKAGKAGKNKISRIPGPLSELTKCSEVPVKDIESWVNRSLETRIQEARERKGHIARPMNSFMLYRSAYAERAKAWCQQNNHQVVSSAAGESWPLESDELRETFHQYALVERANHALAFPAYKFSPRNGRKQKDDGDDNEETFSNKDPDDEYRPSRRFAKQAQAVAVAQGLQVGGPSRADPYVYAPTRSPYHNEWINGSTTRPLPAAYGGIYPHDNHYYQWYASDPYGNQIDNTTNTPMLMYGASQPVGLPGTEPYNFQQARNEDSILYRQIQPSNGYYDPSSMHLMAGGATQSGPGPATETFHFEDAYAAYPKMNDLSPNDPEWASIALDPTLMGLGVEEDSWLAGGGRKSTG